MDKKRSVLNVSTSIVSRFLLLTAAFIVRRLLIHHIGNEVNGLNSLYASLIGMLTVAEMGVGRAIVFSMYRPIIDGNQQMVAALFILFRKAYRIIGLVIFAAGILLIPFLPLLIKDYETLHVNVYLTFFLTLVSVALSYLYSAKISLIEAYKDNYLTTGILTIGRLFRYGLQIAAILCWKSYTVFLLCQILETLLIWGLTEAAVRCRYGSVLSMRAALDLFAKAEITRNIKAMFMHKVGTILVNSVDGMVISGFIGVAVLGKYSNFELLASVAAGTIARFFSSLTSVVGHLCAAGDPAQKEHYFKHFYCLNYILGLVFFLGYFAIADPIVSLCFGPDQKVSRFLVFIISLNQFTKFMRNAQLLFRDASGTFYYDRWKPVAEGVVNLILSVIFVKVFPENFKAAGVIAATVITTLLICDLVEPYVIFRYVFGKRPGRFYLRNYVYIALFAASLLLLAALTRPCENAAADLLINGMLSFAVSAGILCLLSAADKDFRHEIRTMTRAFSSFFRKLR